MWWNSDEITIDWGMKYRRGMKNSHFSTSIEIAECANKCFHHFVVFLKSAERTAPVRFSWLYVCRIEIQNLEPTCSWNDLNTAFRPFGSIATLNYIRHSQSSSVKGKAALVYRVPDAARLAIQRMNLVPLRGCCLSVSILLAWTYRAIVGAVVAAVINAGALLLQRLQ